MANPLCSTMSLIYPPFKSILINLQPFPGLINCAKTSFVIRNTSVSTIDVLKNLRSESIVFAGTRAMWLIVRVNVGVMIVRLRSCQGQRAVVLAKYGILLLMIRVMKSMAFLPWCEISSVTLNFSTLSQLNRTYEFLLPWRFSFISNGAILFILPTEAN